MAQVWQAVSTYNGLGRVQPQAHLLQVLQQLLQAVVDLIGEPGT